MSRSRVGPDTVQLCGGPPDDHDLHAFAAQCDEQFRGTKAQLAGGGSSRMMSRAALSLEVSHAIKELLICDRFEFPVEIRLVGRNPERLSVDPGQ
jgi:hypothetical protein